MTRSIHKNMFYWPATNASRPRRRARRVCLLLARGSFYRASMPCAARLAVLTRMAWVRAVLRMCAALWLVTPREASAEEASPAVRVTPAAAAGIWTLAQLVPSPLYVAGSDRVGAGVRWQITPFVYAFGVAAKPVRAFVIEPVARHAGAIELYASPEWACCAPGQATSWIARGGARLYLPLVGRGEALTGSLGGSYYRAGDGEGASIEAGLHVLFGMLGLTVTVSPRLTGREVISALQIRYF